MTSPYRHCDLIDDTFVITHVVDEFHHGMRTDVYLKKHFKNRSRNQIQTAISNGNVKISGKTAKASRAVRNGDTVVVYSRHEIPEPKINDQFTIIHEDEELLVINKPGNLPVHPAGRFVFNTLLMILRRQRKDWIEKGNNFYLIHRLDRDTSGLMVLAKNKETAGILSDQFRKKVPVKKYFAVAHGLIEKDEFSVDADIGSDPNSDVRLKMASFPKGKMPEDQVQPALTKFTVLKRKSNKTLLLCELKTGRQHQIRVHLAHIGHPIVGDKLYGGREDLFLDYIKNGMSKTLEKKLLIPRHALHSCYLKFFHQSHDKYIELNSPIPNDLDALIQ